MASATTRKPERLEARLTSKQKLLLQRAADIKGRSLTDFVISSAQAAAEETIRTHDVIELTARDAALFFATLENAPPLDPRIVTASDLPRSDG